MRSATCRSLRRCPAPGRARVRLPLPIPVGQPLPGAPTPPAIKDIIKPKVTKLAVTAAKGRKLTISFTTSEAGRATVRVLRELPGRRNGKTCSATRKAGKRCTIHKAYGSITKVGRGRQGHGRRQGQGQQEGPRGWCGAGRGDRPRRRGQHVGARRQGARVRR